MVDLIKAIGCSEDNCDIFVGLLELDYKKTGNPMCVWNAILRLDKIGMKNYPAWVCKYLVRSAENLKKCDHVQKGMSGIAAAFDLKGNNLYEEDIEVVEMVYNLMREKIVNRQTIEDMREKIGNGQTIEDASHQTEYEIDQRNTEILGMKKPKPKERGYFGVSKIEKIYRELSRIEKDM